MSTHLFFILLCRWRINDLDTITSEDEDNDYEKLERFCLPLSLFEKRKFNASRYRKKFFQDLTLSQRALLNLLGGFYLQEGMMQL